MGLSMIAWFLFEFLPSIREVKNLIMNPFYSILGLIIIIAWCCVSCFVAFLFLSIMDRVCKLSDDSKAFYTLIVAFNLPIVLPFALAENVDFFNEKYMSDYANGNYKYSKIMRHCITQDEANYRDEDGNPIDHNTVRVIMLCYQWERYAFNKQEKKDREAAKIEQIKKEVR